MTQVVELPIGVPSLDAALGGGIAPYSFPEEHWPNIRTSNIIERTFEEVKKRSKKMAAAFRNEGSCLLLFYAVVRTLRLRKIRMEG